MLESIRFKNYKALRDTTLPLGRFNVLIGPNGSGKSTALNLIRRLRDGNFGGRQEVVTAAQRQDNDVAVQVELLLARPFRATTIALSWTKQGFSTSIQNPSNFSREDFPSVEERFWSVLRTTRVFSFHPEAIVEPRPLTPSPEMFHNGANLVLVLDRMRDLTPERFERVNNEIGHWLPEFDRILFDTNSSNQRTFSLRQREGGHRIDAPDLSHGTLIALAISTLAWLPNPPPLVCIEEPDRGIHPRLLRDLQDALFRLAFPEEHGDDRPPVQVIVTTHSPMFLNLFKDNPEHIIVAEKLNGEAKFKRITDMEHSDEIIGGAPLGDLWYTGVLGGVPHHR